MSKPEFKEMVDRISGKTVEFFKEHGDNHAGVGWFKPDGLNERYAAHCSIISNPGTVLDFGCGLGAMYEWMQKNGYRDCDYTGLDNSEVYINRCKEKFTNAIWIKGDSLDQNQIGNFDYIIMCGIFTMKLEYTNDVMWEYTKELIQKNWKKCNKGIAFNFTSPIVDWEREDLFHLSFDKIAGFLCKEISRNFEIKAHYGGTYEYTVTVKK